MIKRHIDKKGIYNVAVSFRAAIVEARQNREFSKRDRMSNFPKGCCDDSCDLLAYYLRNEFQIYTKQGNGVYRDNNPYNTTNHAWLIVNDIIIDITADQFPSLIDYVNGIYVGNESKFYKNLEDTKVQENYNIKECSRLWEDYQTIVKYIAI